MSSATPPTVRPSVLDSYLSFLGEDSGGYPLHVAAIKALTEDIRTSDATTMMGLRDELRCAGEQLKLRPDAPISIASLCELFVRFITRTALDFGDFDSCKSELKLHCAPTVCVFNCVCVCAHTCGLGTSHAIRAHSARAESWPCVSAAQRAPMCVDTSLSADHFSYTSFSFYFSIDFSFYRLIDRARRNVRPVRNRCAHEDCRVGLALHPGGRGESYPLLLAPTMCFPLIIIRIIISHLAHKKPRFPPSRHVVVYCPLRSRLYILVYIFCS